MAENWFPNSKRVYMGKGTFINEDSSQTDNNPIDFEPTNDDGIQDKSSSLYFWEIFENGTQFEYILSTNDMNKVYDLGIKLTKQSSLQYGNGKDSSEQYEKQEKVRRLSILGSDTRWQVTDATYAPWKYVGLIESNVGTCSGILIGPKHVLTAAQCVRQKGSKGSWHSNIKFYPGRTSSSTPTSYYWSKINVFNGWVADLPSNDYQNHDMALITLSSEPKIGWATFAYDSGITTSWSFYSKGYPRDKSYGSMWSTSDNIYASWDYGLMTDDSDTYNGGGYRGAPWYHYETSGAVVYAVDTNYGLYFNIHTKITASKFYVLCSWINDASVGC